MKVKIRNPKSKQIETHEWANAQDLITHRGWKSVGSVKAVKSEGMTSQEVIDASRTAQAIERKAASLEAANARHDAEDEAAEDEIGSDADHEDED